MKAQVPRLAHTGDHLLQAEAFTSLLARLGPLADPASAFISWSNSKDFGPADRSAIAREVCGLLAWRNWP